MDVDSLIMNSRINLEDLVDRGSDLYASEDWGGINTGVFILRLLRYYLAPDDPFDFLAIKGIRPGAIGS